MGGLAGMDTIITYYFYLTFDKSITDLCIGTDEFMDDIFPCTWVAYNRSGVIMIENGWITLDGIQIRRLSEFNPSNAGMSMEYRNNNSNNVFSMEPGRTLFMSMRLCNEAELCTNKSMGSVIITSSNTDLETSLDGQAITISVTGAGNGRKKRAVGTCSGLNILTPNSKFYL